MIEGHIYEAHIMLDCRYHLHPLRWLFIWATFVTSLGLGAAILPRAPPKRPLFLCHNSGGTSEFLRGWGYHYALEIRFINCSDNCGTPPCKQGCVALRLRHLERGERGKVPQKTQKVEQFDFLGTGRAYGKIEYLCGQAIRTRGGQARRGGYPARWSSLAPRLAAVPLPSNSYRSPATGHRLSA